jgi:ribose-phosphate pyrophosphokinase
MLIEETMLKSFMFPAGEVHVRDPRPSLDPGILYLPIPTAPEDDDEDSLSLNDWIMQILLLTNVKKRAGHKFSLFLPYLPYSRQDRPTSPNEPFSLKVFGDLINSQGYEKVYTLDVHSDVAFGCIDNLVNIPISFIFHNFKPKEIDFKDYVLVVPDQGAYKRLHALQPYFKWFAVALKHRDTKTGHLKIEGLIGDVVAEKCLIVDDICDGGGTFKLLADALMNEGAESVDLFVTHGIFSKGPELDKINNIYTTNSYRDLTPEGWEHVTVIDAIEVLKSYVN